ncbi:GNAT family N-acetyltransferase [Longispora sp. NPDC051575]|uniref:GNAT family N-acetyltransferase n=1 Tax=Longispora sp. NPDC051575 TaxID=3154943 RepID=UPI00343647B2
MLIIRDATGTDLPATVDVHVRTWKDAYRGLVPDAYLDAIDAGAWLERQRAGMGTPGRHRIVAVLDGVIAGFAGCGPDRDDPDLSEVYAIYVDPGRQGHGIGRALMDAAVGRLGGRVPPGDSETGSGRRTVRLWCAEGNAATRRFYERYGFVADGATRVYDRDGLSLATLRYTLTA